MTIMNHEGLSRFFHGRRRFQLAWIFAILLPFFASHYPTLFGTLICFSGATLRFISSGYLRKESKLAVGGPYAYTRNPLYLGTFIMGMGAIISVGAYMLALIMGLVFFLNYHYVIQYEEAKLPKIFGNSYEVYCQLVPRFIPRISKPSNSDLMKINSDPAVFEFSMSLAIQNKALEAYASFLGLILGVTALVYIRKMLGLG